MTTRNSMSASSRHRRRGAALIEFIFIVPLLATLIAFTWFFGYAMKNQQRVRVASRYQAWRSVRPGDRGPRPWPTLNEMFFYDNATSSGSGGSSGPTRSLDDLAEATTNYGDLTTELAEELLLERHVAHGSHASASASFPTHVGAWDRFQGSIRYSHTRDGHEWRLGQINYLEPVRDVFLQELDDEIMGIAHASLREKLRRLYLKRW